MLCVFCLYIACAILGFIKLDYLKGIVSDAMRELFNKAMIEKLTSAKYAVNEIQKQLQCCGNVGPSEYAGDIPPSCSSFVIGCNQAFYDFYWRNTLLMSLVGLIFGIIHVSLKIKCSNLKKTHLIYNNSFIDICYRFDDLFR